MRDSSLDFLPAAGASIHPDEITAYSDWLKLSLREHGELRRCILSLPGVSFEYRSYDTSNGIDEGDLYTGLSWNFESGPDDLFTHFAPLCKKRFYQVRQLI